MGWISGFNSMFQHVANPNNKSCLCFRVAMEVPRPLQYKCKIDASLIYVTYQLSVQSKDALLVDSLFGNVYSTCLLLGIHFFKDLLT